MDIVKEILTSTYFGDRPINQSAQKLMFNRAIGLAPGGAYWQLLRRLASLRTPFFATKHVLEHQTRRQLDCDNLLHCIWKEQAHNGIVSLRKHLRAATFSNIMGLVFGRRYHENTDSHEAKELNELVKEGFEIVGTSNLCDHLLWLR
ncbi:hypothetical protein Ancab_036209 [Ancistrocladus abbreviatus]